MKRWLVLLAGLFASGFLLLIAYLSLRGGVPLLLPQGSIGVAERNLMVHATLLMLIVAVPVYVLVILIALRYRAQNTKAAYTPDWEHSKLEEFVWWVIPFEIILVLGALTWNATHALDPERAIKSTQSPYIVQAVALPWKWLFIYPDTNVASVNELTIPAGRPVEFQITADAPMNSLWIPALGGQMYAMAGMTTHLSLLASKVGTYEGGSANYSGEGFGSMSFPVRVLSATDFAAWEAGVHASSTDTLSSQSFAELKKPSSADPVRYYGFISFGFMDIVHDSIGIIEDSTR